MKKRIKYTNKVSLQSKLIRMFLLTSAVPILFLSFFSYYNISNTLKKTTMEFSENNLRQTGKNLEIWLESYEDLLYQIYTDDDVVSLVDKLNNEEDVPVAKNQLRRYLRGLLNTKEYIRSITIITSEGVIITYDQLTPVTIENSWIDNFSLSPDEIYEEISSDNKTHVFPTEYGANFANNDYFLFHISHRIIDYKDLDKKSGVAIVSIDEKFLRNVCLTQDELNEEVNSFNFIVDNKGRIISYINQNSLLNQVTDEMASLEERQEDYMEFIVGEGLFEKEYISINTYRDGALQWDIVNVSNQRDTITKLGKQQEIDIIVSLLSLTVVIVLTVILSRQLSNSIKQVVSTMQVASSGNLKIRVKADKQMPIEVESIALQFNDMLGKLDDAMKKEKKAGERQRQAEIRALEAQINPHFLYNTLDTINWMAIDKNEFDISNAISSLAAILRHAIKNSNITVEIRDEVQWLKNYIYLQQTRLKNSFRCEINVDPEVLDCKIHKLLLQPFIENSIIHGFAWAKKEHILEIEFKLKGELVHITVKDNGKGIEPSLVESYNNEVSHMTEDDNHIGIRNAISRLHMYYGDKASVHVSSTLGEGTVITLLIPWR
ncbi:MAG: sensor histidine kinase [Anaerolineaceae bacterium]|nr:MAG: sensor histidine kinase [Anaerolineaceae bacterium]